MVKYLHGDGVDDYLRTPSMAFNRIVIDAALTPKAYTRYVAINDSGFWRNGSNQDALDWKFNAIYKNAVQQTSNTTIVVAGQRAIFDLRTSSVQTSYINFLTDYAGTGDKILGDIWDIKIYNGTTLQAQYDMTTGNVQDQSGNGRHATLTGGTWLDDGAGGGDTGTDGSTAFDAKQQVYSDSFIHADFKNVLYSDSSTLFDTLQQLFESGSDGSFTADFLIRLYQESTVQTDLKQTIYSDTALSFDTLQDLIDNSMGSIKFDVNMILYADSQNVFDSKQAWYTDGQFETDLLQRLVEPSKAIIGVINIQANGNTAIYLKGSRSTAVHINGNISSPIHLKGGIQ